MLIFIYNNFIIFIAVIQISYNYFILLNYFKLKFDSDINKYFN